LEGKDEGGNNDPPLTFTQSLVVMALTPIKLLMIFLAFLIFIGATAIIYLDKLENWIRRAWGISS
jgi:hypothetical protein